MKKVRIVSGNFSDAGNYSGYDANGVRYFIHKRLMENNGWKTDAEVKDPFFAFADTKMIGQLDENGEPLADDNGQLVQVERLQVLSVFKTREELIASVVEDKMLDIDITVAIKTRAVTAGLSDKSIEDILSFSF